MDKTMSMTGNHNHDDDASSMKRINKCDNGDVACHWSDLNHDIILLVMMKTGVIDFLAFGGVCKSWRSVALQNKNKFMASKSPMSICISTTNDNKKECHLKDFEGRKFKTTIPHSPNIILTQYIPYIGLTCGYVILYGEDTRDFWIVNPITRHELHFPGAPFDDYYKDLQSVRAILVFSRSISEWVFVVFSRSYYNKIWFSRAGKREWTYVSTGFHIHDLHAFKGKIYALHSFQKCLSEVRLYPTPKPMLIEIKNFPKPNFDHPVLVSLGENLYVMEPSLNNVYKIINSRKMGCVSLVYKIINSSKIGCVSLEKVEDKFTLYFSKSEQGASIISDIPSQYKSYAVTLNGPTRNIYSAKMWYFFHDCLNVNLLHE